MNWNKFINFDQLIMPWVIKVIYVIASLLIILYALAFPGGEVSPGWPVSPLMRILFAMLGLLGVRLYCELIIVLFKISANVSKIAAKAE